MNVSLEDLLETESKSTTKLSDSFKEHLPFDKVYELNKKEKSLVSLYRSLTPEAQDKILKDVSKKTKLKND